jgi:hypothetical protein
LEYRFCEPASRYTEASPEDALLSI